MQKESLHMAKETLLRMLRYQLDIKRKDIVLVQRQLEQAEKALEKYKTELETEKQKAQEDAMIAVTFLSYLKRMRRQEQVLLENKSALVNHMKALEEDISQLFSEAKKYDILLEISKQREKESRAESEQKTLDELSSTRFIRQQEHV